MEDVKDLTTAESDVLAIDFYPDTSFLTQDIGQYTKIPISDISAMGAAAASVFANVAQSAEGLYHVSFPRGAGEIVKAKGGGYRAMLRGADGKFTGQGVLRKASGVNPVDLCSSLTMAAISRQLTEIKRLQTEMIELLERDKKAQLLADLELLTEYTETYRLYESNASMLSVHLNQVQNIRRNAKKDVVAYREQIEELLAEKRLTLPVGLAREKVSKLYDRAARYKLANCVHAYASFLEVILAKNYGEEYLRSVSEKMRLDQTAYQALYDRCHDEVQRMMQKDVFTVLIGGLADTQRFAGKTLSRIPFKKAQIGDKLRSQSESNEEKEKERIEKTVKAFAQLEDSGSTSFIEKVDQINGLINRPCELIWDRETLYIVPGEQEKTFLPAEE